MKDFDKVGTTWQSGGDSLIQERDLCIASLGLAAAFPFYMIFLALIPVNSIFGMFMIAPTIGLAIALIFYIKSVVLK
ncbi:MAG: hypothetical protein ACFFC7_29290 [Candidatus Hermodarchaeota archaeon]